MGNNSLINLGDFAEPANTLINKVSDALGGIARPFQIVRVAKANAEAEKIQAAAHLEINDMQRRALTRFIAEETKKQNNIESITLNALQDLSENSQPQNINDDWLLHFFDKSKLISDQEMQSYWSKILAGEANYPGTFSKRTIEIMSYLESDEALSFSRLCRYIFVIHDPTPIIFEIDDDIYKNYGINFMKLSHLESLGLIHFDNIGGYIRKGFKRPIDVNYINNGAIISHSTNETFDLKIGKVLFSKAGEQIASIINPEPIEGFFEYVISKWKTLGYTINHRG